MIQFGQDFFKLKKLQHQGQKFFLLWWASHGLVQVVRIISELFDKFDVPCATSDGCVGPWVFFFWQGKIRDGQFVGEFQPKCVSSCYEWWDFNRARSEKTMVIPLLVVFWDILGCLLPRLSPTYPKFESSSFTDHPFFLRCGSTFWM